MELLHPRCAGLDVHSRQVTACVRVAAGSTVTPEHREFATTMAGLFELSAWLTEAGCTQVAMEATGVYWKDASHSTTSPSVTASSYHRPVSPPCCRHCRVSVKDSDGVLAVVPGERDELV